LLLKPKRYRATPIAVAEILPFEGDFTYSSTNLYQRKVGTLLYAAVIIQLDVTFVVSRLTRFNLNSGPKQYLVADRIIEYLLTTSTFALELGGGEDFTT
jgi:hypothetical protein